IGRFKVTHEDYAFYLKMAGLPAQQFDNKWLNKMLADMTHFKNSPAVVSWTEADNYCRWLKKKTGLAFSLPTEAQWEYAARGRGQYILVATDDDDWREDEKTGRGENYATSEDRQATEEATGVESSFVRYAVDRYPPTPGGLYGMAENGYEWVSDWYDPDYYATSPRQDPQGPETPVIKNKKTGQYLKVRRGGDNPSPGFDVGLTFFRGYAIKDKPYPDGTTVRCAVNAAEAVK
ncbi:TPA: formylglycine-generating enzyme family protein, partial [Klebsiella pneumoniae]